MTLSPPAPVLDTSVLTPFDRITNDIEQAESKAITTFGDYSNPAINKAVRSYLYGLRQIRTSIDRTRKAQNDEAQSYIRNVNSFSKELTERMTALIEPHERIIKGIEEAEKERIALHETNLDNIIDMRSLPAGTSSPWIQSLLDKLTEFDPTTFEEFTPKADAEIQISRTALETALQAALDHEEAEAARERKKAEERAAAQAKREAEIAEAAAARAKAEAEEAAEQERILDQKAAQLALKAEQRKAEAAIAAERKKVEAAERKAAAAEAKAASHETQNETPLPAPEPAFDAEQLPGTRAKRNALAAIIQDAVLDNTPKGFALAVVLGEVHPAILIDWSKVDA